MKFYFRRAFFLTESVSERKEGIREVYGFECDCDACVYEEAGKRPVEPTIIGFDDLKLVLGEFMQKREISDDKAMFKIAPVLKKKIIKLLQRKKFEISYTLLTFGNLLDKSIEVLATKTLMCSIIKAKK